MTDIADKNNKWATRLVRTLGTVAWLAQASILSSVFEIERLRMAAWPRQQFQGVNQPDLVAGMVIMLMRSTSCLSVC
uniref:Uncharacterized protein n=1 Tax=Arundo donax TaxID=35708 RepID=A0A0A8YCM7_ARUDO